MADGKKHKIIAQADVGRLKQVQLVEGLEIDMVSVGQLCDQGHNILLTKDSAFLLPEEMLPDQTGNPYHNSHCGAELLMKQKSSPSPIAG